MSNTTDSSDNSDNSAIKYKKGPAPITMKESGSFLLTLLGKLFVLGIVVVVGTCLVYTCRVAQSNILPTDMNFTPYTDVIPTIVGGDKVVNIDIVKTAEGIFSTKLIFPLTENMNDLRNKGFIVIDVVVDLDELIEYCLKRKIENDGKARSQFVQNKRL